MNASWGSRQQPVETVEELRAIVGAIRASGQPTMVVLEAGDGPALVVGVGHAESVMTFVEVDGTSFHSLGEVNRRGYLEFLWHDQVQEYVCEMAIAEEDAIRAAEHFVRTSERPPDVRWETDG